MSDTNEIFSSYMIGEDSYAKFILEENYDDIEKLCDIVLKIFPNDIEITKGKKYQGITETLEISKEYLSTIDKEYVKDFEDKINDGTFVIYDSNDKESDEYKENKEWVGISYLRPQRNVIEDDEYVTIQRNDNKYRINIPIYYRYTDCSNIIHEYAHSIIKHNNTLGIILSELVPISFEYDFAKYLEDNEIEKNEIKEIITYRVKNLIAIANKLKNIIEYYRNNKHKIDFSININDDRNIEMSKDFLSLIKYLYGDIYGICFYDELCNNEKNIDTIKRVIKIINNESENEFSSEFIDDFMNELVSYMINYSEKALINIREKYISKENVNLKK